MRAKNAEITNPDEIRRILDNCGICRLGLCEGGVPYVLPMNYGYTYVDGIITTFFHSSGEGRKIDILKRAPLTCFEIDCDYRIDPDGNPQRHAVIWESLVGVGTVEFVADFDEKRRMLGNMMRKFRAYNRHYRPNKLTDDRVADVTMFRLVLDEFKAKRLYHI